MLDKLSIEDIKASVTELMAGGVDTVKHTSSAPDGENHAVSTDNTQSCTVLYVLFILMSLLLPVLIIPF